MEGKWIENVAEINFVIHLVTHTGRWWIVGSAWVGRDTNSAPSSQHGAAAVDNADMAGTSESWVLELARRQRMNTDVRKNIFCVIMTSEVECY